MATILEVMLDVAREMGQVYEGAAASGTTTTLTDSDQPNPAQHYIGGTIWFLSGDNDGGCKRIESHDGNTFEFDTLSDAIVADVEYAVASSDYPRQKLKQAVQAALKYDDYLQKDDTLTVIDDTEEYTLPSGVSRVLKVEVAIEDAEPYNWQPNYNWREWNGKLIFDPGRQPVTEDRKIRVWYQGSHGEITESAAIKSSVDQTWLMWKAVEWLYRDKIIHIKGDEMNVQLFNEAKEKALEAQKQARNYELKCMNPSPRLSAY